MSISSCEGPVCDPRATSLGLVSSKSWFDTKIRSIGRPACAMKASLHGHADSELWCRMKFRFDEKPDFASKTTTLGLVGSTNDVGKFSRCFSPTPILQALQPAVSGFKPMAKETTCSLSLHLQALQAPLLRIALNDLHAVYPARSAVASHA